jgi:predicted ribosome quality control (RQC) complex YloA/Tae2 family protein
LALDGIFLSLIKNEINTTLEFAKVDKVQQPEKDEIDIIFRLRGGAEKLLISASASNPRIHFTQNAKENPMQAPMFCMLLRKHLCGGKFSGARQQGLERILFLDFDCYNELGDEVRRTLAVEIMGRHSNIMLLDENGRILDAIKHIDETMSAVRQVFPGMKYELPPQQDKLNILEAASREVTEKILSQKTGLLDKAILTCVQGVSPIICREIAQLVCRNTDTKMAQLDLSQQERLKFFLERIADDLKNNRQKPVMVQDTGTHKPLDFAFMEITQYGRAASTKQFESFSQLLDNFYFERDRIEHFSQRSQDILKLIANIAERAVRKLNAQKAELVKCADRQELKICGDLISSNLYQLHKGDTACELENYYEEGSPLKIISLDFMLTPAQNAQKYYKEYRKASVAENHLLEQIETVKIELEYLDTVFDELSRASSESELAEIRVELISQGYLKSHGKIKGGKNGVVRKVKESKPLKFMSADGFEIYVGRNNHQNDRLTMKMAAKTDIWLHTRNIPGAHVVIAANNARVPDSTITFAACLAAAHSKAKDSGKVPVDFTLVKNVKKPSGAKPGMVIYDNFKTAFVDPIEDSADKE